MTTYAQLQNDVLELIPDTLVQTPADAQKYIRLAEYKLERDLIDTANGGKVPHQIIARYTGVVGANAEFDLSVLPDWQRARAVKVSGNICKYSSPELINTGAEGYEDQALELDYYGRLPILSDTNTSNWLLDVAYDTYLWGSAIQWTGWGLEAERLALWTEFYRDGLRTVKETYAAQPRGSFQTQIGYKYKTYYTIVGRKILFGTAK